MIDISRALTIDGWMPVEELTWLAEQASRHRVIVEVGSYLGRSTRALADNTAGTVYAIDNFFGPTDIGLADDARATVLERFRENIAGCANVVTLVADHGQPPMNLAPDMVFIDGSHVYEAVLRDIRTWSAAMVRGGLICGHDYHPDWEGVMRAVNQSFPNIVVPPGTTIWQGESDSE